jgi:hypothetical protein
VPEFSLGIFTVAFFLRRVQGTAVHRGRCQSFHRQLALSLDGDDTTKTEAPIPEAPPSWRDLLLALTGIDLLVCPVCRSRPMERRPFDDSTTSSRPPDT